MDAEKRLDAPRDVKPRDLGKCLNKPVSLTNLEKTMGIKNGIGFSSRVVCAQRRGGGGLGFWGDLRKRLFGYVNNVFGFSVLLIEEPSLPPPGGNNVVK